MSDIDKAHHPDPVAVGVEGEKLEHGLNHTEHVDLNENLEAKIKNPLKGISRAQLMQDVEAFAHEKGLVEHIPLLRKGALVAQSPADYDEIDGPEALTEHEKVILSDEVMHKWRLPWQLYLTIATCSIGAAVQGWDQTGSNGASIFFPEVYGIGSDSRQDALLVGTVNAGPYIGCALLGCWLSDPCNNYLGRRGTIFLSANFCLWPVIGSAFCNTWWEQLICRLLMGVGMGIKASTVPIYAAENAPASVRGALVMSWQMWTAFGIFLGTAVNLAVFYHANNWRLMLGAPFIPAVPLLCLIYLCPESPRWLMKKNKYAAAWKSMVVLRNDPIQAARDIYYIHAQLSIEMEMMRKSNYVTRFTQLFTIPRVRRASVAAFTVMIAQQMCGINIIAFYSTTLFVNSGFSQFNATLCSFGFGAVNWLFAFPAFWTIDTFGRRSLLLFTFPNMMWTLLAAGLCNLLPEGSIQKTATVALFVFLFAAFYSPGEGPVPFTYSAEVFPLSHREVGMGFAVATCLGFAAVLGITFPLILKSLGTVGAFCLYAGFNGVAFVMIFFLVPETKQRTLEELDYVFAVPNRKFASYQVNKVLPWWFNRWILFKKNAYLEPLYQQEDVDNFHRVARHHSNDFSSDPDKKAAL
ncbi:Uu.00g050520.m01.CDS01 [Anthostomella pinea]|uniref:Uu.00g050520.m01.CDS01 n=1 Tax=Anthostomella pinea TaxID=933095 RepID=A0AAI8VTH9_9PEZI|nr:Uu.00g050520.m01.CDS01 [Anthostomella pinea]